MVRVADEKNSSTVHMRASVPYDEHAPLIASGPPPDAIVDPELPTKWYSVTATGTGEVVGLTTVTGVGGLGLGLAIIAVGIKRSAALTSNKPSITQVQNRTV